jgi:hypothetical protein
MVVPFKYLGEESGNDEEAEYGERDEYGVDHRLLISRTKIQISHRPLVTSVMKTSKRKPMHP